MLTAEERRKILRLWQEGYSKNAIARELNRSWSTIDKVIKQGEQGEQRKGIDFKREFQLIDFQTELELALKLLNSDPAHLHLQRKIEFALKNIRHLDTETMKMLRNEVVKALS